MIKIIDGEILNRTKRTNERARWQVTLVSETEPTSLEITGADVEGMDDTDIIAVGSVLMTPSAKYVAFEDGVFTQKG